MKRSRSEQWRGDRTVEGLRLHSSSSPVELGGSGGGSDLEGATSRGLGRNDRLVLADRMEALERVEEAGGGPSMVGEGQWRKWIPDPLGKAACAR